MPLPTASSAARTALVYITLGALIVIWTGVWFVYLVNHQENQIGQGIYYLIAGLMITGVVLMAIGLGLGRIGSAARKAEVPIQTVVAPPMHGAPVVVNTPAPVQQLPADSPAQGNPTPPVPSIKPPVASR
jgi:hypothetical protein